MASKSRSNSDSKKIQKAPITSKFLGVSRDTRSVPKATRLAKELAVKTVRSLRRRGDHDRHARKLADELDSCTRKCPCWSAACPVCGLAISRHLTAEFARVLRDKRGEGTIAAVTIVVPSGAVSVGQLARFHTSNFVRRLKNALNEAGVGWMIGALDVSLNMHDTDRYEPHWSVHLHAFTVTDDVAALRRHLTDVFERTDAIPRPVKVTEWDGSKRGIRYTLKTRSQRRIGIDDAKRHDPKTGKSRKGRATKTDRLRASEKSEMTKKLHSMGPEGRLFLRNAQLRGSGNGPTLSLINSAARREKS
jgi:hypothetical protein